MQQREQLRQGHRARRMELDMLDRKKEAVMHNKEGKSQKKVR